MLFLTLQFKKVTTTFDSKMQIFRSIWKYFLLFLQLGCLTMDVCDSLIGSIFLFLTGI